MFIRRKPNKSGTFSVQVIRKHEGRFVVVRSFGASSDEEELQKLEKEASAFIITYGGQLTLDLSETPRYTASVFLDHITSVIQNGIHIILDPIYNEIGFNKVKDDLLRQLVISRISQPLSKLATVDYLKRYNGYDVDISKIYRFMDRLDEDTRQLIQQISVEHTTKILGGCIGIVFYDVTTLYFESAKDDELRARGFSKDGKTAETQIVLGLLVSMDGYPLSYSIFNGGQYEGRTLIPVIDDFVQRFNLKDFIIVADAGLLSRKNITLLKAAGYKFILGGRIKKESESVVNWILSLDKDEKKLHETVINGDERIIVGYSPSRASKDAYNRQRGIDRLRKAYASGKVTKTTINQRGYNKFLTVEKDVKVEINEEKVKEDAKWDGLKSYVTNSDLPAQEVVDKYHGLWVVERAFRVSKGRLETRPIFHFTIRRIEAHICICFMAYKVYKELERQLGLLKIPLSVDKVLDIAKTISTITVTEPDGTMTQRTLLLTTEQQMLAPLLPPR